MGALLVSFNQVTADDLGAPECCFRIEDDNRACWAMSFSRHYWLSEYVEHLVPDIFERAASADRSEDDEGHVLFSADYCGIAAAALDEAFRSGGAAAYCKTHESRQEAASSSPLDTHDITEFRDFLRISGGYRYCP